MSFPKYPAYKDSEVEWIGEIPVGWNLLNGRRLFADKKISARSGDEQLSATQKYGVIPQKDFMKNEDQKVTLAISGIDNFRHVDEGDFVISLRSFQGGIEYSSYNGCVSPAYTVLCRKNKINDIFWSYIFKSRLFIDEINASSEGIRDGKTIRYEQFGKIAFAIPPLPEQQAIASFLDRECGKIDALIAEQERLIALLAEKRQAVISHAVTKGLNPNVPMKDSGIPWIGMVPEGWEVHLLKNVASVQTGIAKGKEVIEQKSVQMPYLRVANVQDGYLDLSEVSRINIDRDQVERYLLRQGDVLMNEGGDFDKLGRGAIWHGEISPCIHQNHVFAVRPKSIMSEWMSAVIGSDYAKFYFMTRSKQSTNLASISSTNLMMLPIIVPSIDDQKTIVNFLESKKSQFENLMNSANSIITLLKERRAALISAAVTGKIDVRTQSKALVA
ncbi:type I restriction-modification methylase S subunit [Komagataeibacter xylinus NBRC 13693]|uniref:Type I restriction-modification methylase S subunit n=1 Tax=Komagataeibacter xylinus NBRC 13693 TaxID=1234668 RepID=A0A0D6QDC3_KOMXY